jgi:hypothetical protein
MSTYPVHANKVGARVRNHFGVAWMALCAALAVHVADEAFTNFLSVYNPAVRTIRSHLPFLPLPEFSFPVWLTGLIAAVILLFSLSPFAFREARLMAPLAYMFGAVMLGNGLLHIGSSIYLGRVMPGVYSAPFLVVCSLYLLTSVRIYRREKR